jgi:putative DNA primase/helicase
LAAAGGKMEKITDRKKIRALVEKRRLEEEKKHGKGNGGDDEPPELSLKFVKDCLRWNQAGDGELYKAIHRDEFLFDRSAGTWLRWAGHHWEIDKHAKAYAGVGEVALEYERKAYEIRRGLSELSKEERKWQEKLAEKLDKRAEQLRTKARVETTIFFAHTSEDGLSITGSEMDSEPYLLPFKNGVIELQSGEFRDGRRSDRLLKAVPHDFQGYDANAPVFEDTLAKVFLHDEEIIEFFQRLCGSTLVAGNPDQKFTVCWGKNGANGKNVIFDILCNVLGPLARPIPAGTLLQASYNSSSSSPAPDLMMLKGLRVAIASENDEFARIAQGRIKELTGNEFVVARRAYDKEMSTFSATHTIFLLTNDPPRADGADTAFWRRVILLEFPARFVEHPTAENEFKKEKDDVIKSKLISEAPGILAWLVEGCLKWKKFGLAIPAKVQNAANQYQANEDLLGQWIDERCYTGADHWAWANDLHDDFSVWWSDNIGSNPPKPQKFGRWMRKRFEFKKPCKIKYIGIGLRYPD